MPRRTGRTGRTGRTRTAALIGLAAASGAGHVLYPVALGLLHRARRAGPVPLAEPGAGGWPGLSVVVPAYREVGTIAAKLDDLRANGYPGELELLVVAEDHDTAAVARASGARVLEPSERLGKARAINAGVEAASHGIVVMTDANNSLAPGSLAALARQFGDPAVGGAAGAKTEEGAGEAIYWRFESWLMQRESELGTTLGLVGELFAVRRSAWEPIPDGVGSDDLWTALDLMERGYCVRYVREATSVEPSAVGGDQWERRTRISAGALNVFVRKRHLLHPRHGLVAFEIIGHKLWRQTVGPVAHVGLLGVALAERRRSGLARLVLGVHAAVGVGALAQRAGAPVPRVLTAGYQAIYLEGVAMGGMHRFLVRGDAPAWVKQAR